MLQIEKISKKYQTGDLVQQALDQVSLNFRKSEFVAILGPSGSGKTTLLNIIGGLDQYDSGDLIINNISTKKYKDRDWDSYRNHTIGFVFQSYNLIGHQTILANVELALTISGVSRSERKQRAIDALKQVGLGDHIHKKPNQLSGGQMQRVAIARALINDPNILLADEPTGALDTETSEQVMDLLAEVAKDRLVIMVTHNPELAEDYATRIVQLKDGVILSDSNPYEVKQETQTAPEHKNLGKASISFLTSLQLSFNNLRTKKGRTLLTAFAGSIGIIGIALILSLSTGVNNYIANIQKDTMATYPITIEAETVDLTSQMAAGGMRGGGSSDDSDDNNHKLDGVYSNGKQLEASSSVDITENNLTAFKKYLDSDDNKISQYVGENGIAYTYDVAFDIYTYDPDETLVNTDGSTLTEEQESSTPVMSGPGGAGGAAGMSSGGMSTMMTGGNTTSASTSETLSELLPGTSGDLVSDVEKGSYDVVSGNWPENYDEVMIVLDENNEISLQTLYYLGLLPADEYSQLMEDVENEENFTAETYDWSYEDVQAQTFKLVSASDYYEKNDNGTFSSIEEDAYSLENLVSKAQTLKVAGIIRPKEDADNATLTGTIAYSSALTDYLIDYAADSEVVKAQLADPDVNVMNEMTFEPADDNQKAEDAKKYYSDLGVTDKATLWKGMAETVYADQPQMLQGLKNMDEAQLAEQADQYIDQASNETLLSIYDNYVSSGTYEDNMAAFGYVNKNAPSSISIYSDSFEDKDAIASAIEDYNDSVEDANKITYTDFVEVMMSSVTTIINVISYVLVAFVAVSLIVSSIMIGIITYISVLERTKEIGILRAIGASKGNISKIFNAETFIVGLCAGLLGVGISYLALIPGNALIHRLIGSGDVSASLPISYAVILIVISILLTLIGGFVPAKKAAKKDPVEALRTE
ncbi:ABC transporter ATP-binding protein/permease [Listeria innocua]|nr:ABC transporter ATP-binding protein/permease [Listeria innocua]EHT9924288.1 ABC transporter ATP-binding protein/permease [Listeria monocytogenes]EDO1199635.1 ATP-binding cassette domain-containing protein [Listeria innocua]EHF3591964.1 ABC transporter ATP-binding protein/permease [Listeria innocua]EHF3607038.1 ABC transporter ATP-binding protein/permease [Listeria innocua]